MLELPGAEPVALEPGDHYYFQPEASGKPEKRLTQVL
jgi:hypothetical protein